jgi:ABC-type sulfate transport system substrate-binding protein
MPNVRPSTVHRETRSALSGPRATTRRPSEATLLSAADACLRPFFLDYDRFFSRYWRSRIGAEVRIVQQDADGSALVPALVAGLEADVVGLATDHDVDALHVEGALVGPDWRTRLPRASVPFRSRLVLLVRSGNPKRIRSWADLLRGDVHVAGAADAVEQVRGGSGRPGRAVALARLASPLPNAVQSILTEGRDVSVVLESAGEVPGLKRVAPREEVWGAPRVAVLDPVVDAHGTRTLAEAYVAYLYSPVGQHIAARHRFTPWMG